MRSLKASGSINFSCVRSEVSAVETKCQLLLLIEGPLVAFLDPRPTMNAHVPAAAETEDSITRYGFKITTRKLPILKAGPIEEMNQKLGIAPPEMIFGDNFVRIDHVPTGWNIVFNAFDALDLVDKTGNKMLKVAYSKEWQQNR